MQVVGIESCYGFGDGCFNIPLIEAIAEKYNSRISVAVKKSCEDVFYNVPCIKEIINISDLYQGINHYNRHKIKNFQITQNCYFPTYRNEDCEHSLASTALVVGNKVCGVDFNPRPKIYLNDTELSAINKLDKSVKNVAIESEYYSGQSWANDNDFERLIIANPNVKFWWLSLRKPQFNYGNIIYASSMMTRRECVALISNCDLFVSVGSGMFCATLSMIKQPKNIWILWIDDYYKYENFIMKNKWLPDSTRWIKNRNDWNLLILENGHAF